MKWCSLLLYLRVTRGPFALLIMITVTQNWDENLLAFCFSAF